MTEVTSPDMPNSPVDLRPQSGTDTLWWKLAGCLLYSVSEWLRLAT